MAPGFIDGPVLTAAKDLQISICVMKYAGLNCAESNSIVKIVGFCPGPAPVFCILKVGLPAILFSTGRTKQHTIDQYGFVFNRAEKTCRQCFPWAPCFAVILRAHHPACPTRHIGTDLIKQQQLAVWSIKQNRVITGISCCIADNAIGYLLRGSPFCIYLSARPDANIFISFFCASEPGGYQAVGRFCNGGCMTLRKGCLLEYELIGKDAFDGVVFLSRCNKRNEGNE